MTKIKDLHDVVLNYWDSHTLTLKEYKKLINKIPGRKPPCIQCHYKQYNHCRDKEQDCAAFRSYTGNHKYKHSQIGKWKRPFKLDDNPET